MCAPCKIILNSGGLALIEKTIETLEYDPTAFSEDKIKALMDLDVAFYNAHYLILSGNEEVKNTVNSWKAKTAEIVASSK